MSNYELQHGYDTVNLWRSEGVGKIELARPDSLNSWGASLSADLWSAFETVRDDEGIRAVVVTGAGRAFCSGADLKEENDPFADEHGRPDLERKLHASYHPVLTGLRRLPKPVLAAVNGPAVGVGVSLALSADLVYARQSAYFLLAFVNIGLVPDGGASALLCARVGFTRACELAMLGERLPAERALDWGMINGVFSDDEFEPAIDALAHRLAAGPTRSYAGSKAQLNAWAFKEHDNQLALEAALQKEMSESADFMEGVLAFIEKRSANFSGR
ncbi:MAG: enoyl-CoA hydratase [Actinobacteria bacterium]|nr:enoyl-CoA hydratase [Actinomycetota bacterium]